MTEFFAVLWIVQHFSKRVVLYPLERDLAQQVVVVFLEEFENLVRWAWLAEARDALYGLGTLQKLQVRRLPSA